MAKTLTQRDLEKIISEAQRKGKSADFSGQTIEELILTESQIRIPLFFKKAKILGRLYFYNVIFNEDIFFDSAIANQTFYISECRLKGNLSCKKISIRESLNMTENYFEKNVNLEGAQIRGFLGLNKSKIAGKGNFKKMNVLSLEQRIGEIVGNVYFEKAIVNNLIFKNSIIDGTLTLKDTKILGILNLSNIKIKGDLILTHKDILKAKIRERKKLELEIKE